MRRLRRLVDWFRAEVQVQLAVKGVSFGIFMLAWGCGIHNMLKGHGYTGTDIWRFDI